MKGKTAIITGASRGIGKAIALKLAKSGANIVITYKGNDEEAERTRILCEENGIKAVVYKGNVADEEECKKIVEFAMENFGSVDILVNNAGITKDDVLMRMSNESFCDVINTNLVGVFNMMKATARIMMKQRFGRIINISSVSGIIGNAGQANYSAAKAGVIGLTKSYAREVASRNITVNAVAPGFVKTDMTDKLSKEIVDAALKSIPLGKFGEPEDIANAVCFLASESASYITGEVLRVDGGIAM
ncbi:MAG: 3-oxoacyl-[acyl-carrier-protein] reductase [Eubacteriales bacterium]